MWAGRRVLPEVIFLSFLCGQAMTRRAMRVTDQKEVFPAPRRPSAQHHLGPGKAMGNITLTLTFVHRHVYMRGKQLLAHGLPSRRTSPVCSGVDAEGIQAPFLITCVAPWKLPRCSASWLPVFFCHGYLTCLLNLAVDFFTQQNTQPLRLCHIFIC